MVNEPQWLVLDEYWINIGLLTMVIGLIWTIYYWLVVSTPLKKKYWSVVHTRREALSLAARSHADHGHQRNKTRIGAITK